MHTKPKAKPKVKLQRAKFHVEIHTQNPNIQWPKLRDLQRQNIGTRHAAHNALRQLAYELLEGQALLDRKIAYTILEWVNQAAVQVEPNSPHSTLTYTLREFTLVLSATREINHGQQTQPTRQASVVAR